MYALAADTSIPSSSPSSSGRPSAVLNDSQCQSLWSQAASNGDSLSSDQATSYITDFKLADWEDFSSRIQERLQARPRRVTRSLSLSKRQPTPSLFAIWLQSVSSCGSLKTLPPIQAHFHSVCELEPCGMAQPQPCARLFRHQRLGGTEYFISVMASN
jgi:hypothetical protein